MRDDLNKQLCEHERARSWDCFHNYRTMRAVDKFEGLDEYDDEDLGSAATATSGVRESMKLRYNTWSSRKAFGENLNPLYGWVRKQLGRRWDNSYSELCETFDKRSVINQHILEHLFSYIQTKNIYVEDGQLMFQDRWGEAKRLKDSYVEYYVDPRDGIVKKNKHFQGYRAAYRERVAREAKEKLKVHRYISETCELHKINDVWYEIEFKVQQPYTKTDIRYRVEDPTKEWYRISYQVYPITHDILKGCGSKDRRIAVKKRTLSHKELKAYKLI